MREGFTVRSNHPSAEYASYCKFNIAYYEYNLRHASDVSANTLSERIEVYKTILTIYDSLERVDDYMFKAMDAYYADDEEFYSLPDPVREAVVHNFRNPDSMGEMMKYIYTEFADSFGLEFVRR